MGIAHPYLKIGAGVGDVDPLMLTMMVMMMTILLLMMMVMVISILWCCAATRENGHLRLSACFLISLFVDFCKTNQQRDPCSRVFPRIFLREDDILLFPSLFIRIFTFLSNYQFCESPPMQCFNGGEKNRILNIKNTFCTFQVPFQAFLSYKLF